MKFSGSTLAYTMTITLVIASMLGGILAVNEHYRQILHGRYAEERARENLRSGMAWLMSLSPAGEQLFATNLFESKRDSFYAKTEDWGLLRLVHGVGVMAKQKVSRSCLVGQPLPASTSALMLTENRQPLTVSGNTRIMGDAILGRSDVHAGRVGERRYSGDQMVYGKVFQPGENDVHVFPLTLPHSLKTILHNLPSPIPGVMVLSDIEAEQPWQGNGMVIDQKQSLILENMTLSGKCLIISANEILISQTTSLNHCLLVGRKVVIQDGFSGRIQVFATDTIEVGANVHLQYPSVLGLVKSRVVPALMQMGAGTVLEGEIIFDQGTTTVARNPDDYILINRGATIFGLVKVQHNLDLQGKVNGSVIAGNFLLRTPATVYFNYLLDAVIDPAELSPEFSGAITDPAGRLKIIEWL